MNKKLKFIFLVLFISIFSTGCWNYNELSDMAVVSSIGVDKYNDEYKVSVLISNTTDLSSGENTTAKTSIITGTGYPINNAMEKVKAQSSKNLYLGHLAVVLIDEEIAKDSIYDILEALIRDPESAKKVKLVISKDATSNDILKTLSPLDTFPAQNITSSIDKSIQVSGTSCVTYSSNFLYKIVNYGYDNIMPSISIEGNKSDNNNPEELEQVEPSLLTKVSDIAIFKDFKLVDYANYDESKGINILTNKTVSLSINDKCYKDLDKYIVFKLNDAKTKIDLKIKNDKLKYTFNIEADATIDETNCNLELRSNKTISKMKDSLESEVYDLIKSTIEKTKKIKTDIFGLGNILYKKDYKLWNKIKDDWDDIYSNIDYDINVELKLNKKGTLETTIKEENK